jgi:hypothetical protein
MNLPSMGRSVPDRNQAERVISAAMENSFAYGPHPGQVDSDGDGKGDLCDSFDDRDTDDDGVKNGADNCIGDQSDRGRRRFGGASVVRPSSRVVTASAAPSLSRESNSRR